MCELSEIEWVKELRTGDYHNTFSKVYKHYYKGLCAYSFTLLKDYDASEEIVQDFFVELWENEALRKVDVSLKLYLYRSVHNRCINYLKSLVVSQARLAKYAKYMQDEIELIDIDTESDLYERFFSENFEQEVYKAIDTLAPQQKKIFTLSRFDQKSYTEIAKELDISINSVKTQMSRALNKLRAILVK